MQVVYIIKYPMNCTENEYKSSVKEETGCDEKRLLGVDLRF